MSWTFVETVKLLKIIVGYGRKINSFDMEILNLRKGLPTLYFVGKRKPKVS